MTAIHLPISHLGWRWIDAAGNGAPVEIRLAKGVNCKLMSFWFSHGIDVNVSVCVCVRVADIATNAAATVVSMIEDGMELISCHFEFMVEIYFLFGFVSSRDADAIGNCGTGPTASIKWTKKTERTEKRRHTHIMVFVRMMLP